MKIFIGCSACDEIPSEYFDETKRFLEKLMPGHDLVFGTCKSGLMGIAHDITKELGGKVIGVCPDAYKDDFKTLKCDVEIPTKTVSERTDSVIRESDALVFIAGGIGTLYELLTAIECKRCHEFDKPIVIYNGTGYFDKLLDKKYSYIIYVFIFIFSIEIFRSIPADKYYRGITLTGCRLHFIFADINLGQTPDILIMHLI